LNNTKPIRICHLSSVHKANDTRLFYRECVTLAQHYDTYLVAVGDSDGEWYGVKVKAIPQHNSRLMRFLLNIPHVLIRGLKVNASVYHFHDPELILVGLFLRLLGKKVIYDIHEDVAKLIALKKWVMFPRLVAWVYKLLEAICLPFFYLVVSEDAYEQLYERHTTYVIHNFAFIEKLDSYRRNLRNTSDLNLFYIGSIDELYCVFESLESVYLLKLRGYNPKVSIVGSVSPRIERQIENLPFYNLIKNNITFYGYLSAEEGFQYSIDCSIGLCMVSKNGNSYESYPRKMFEYMGVGLPLITSDFPLYKKVIEKYNCGLCITGNSAIAIADAIEVLIKDQTLRNTMGANGIKAAQEHYNWEKESTKLLSLYQKILGK